jgi:hypothetical protein
MQHGHERRDIDVRLIGLGAFGLAVILAGGLALMAWLFNILDARPEEQGRRGAPQAATPPRPLAPRLQTAPRQEMQEMLRADQARLQSYGWVDRAAGLARIPIERAMELLVVQGLPSWPELPTAQPADRDAVPEEQR